MNYKGQGRPTTKPAFDLTKTCIHKIKTFVKIKMSLTSEQKA
jgi:hypothetical protein